MRAILPSGAAGDEGDTTRLSFLDLMSCALGGIILLFVVFLNTGASQSNRQSPNPANTTMISWHGVGNQLDIALCVEGKWSNPVRLSGLANLDQIGRQALIVFEEDELQDKRQIRVIGDAAARVPSAMVKWVAKGNRTIGAQPATELEIRVRSWSTVDQTDTRSVNYGRWLDLSEESASDDSLRPGQSCS